MTLLLEYLTNLLDLSLAAAPWLVLGLVVGGLINALIPMSFLEKHLGDESFSAIVKAAVLGAPLPLCSCGVIPAAMGLRKAGASKPATVSFLVSTPETGVDSVSVTYALLGPFMAIVRPIAAIASAIVAGMLVGKAKETVQEQHNQSATTASCCSVSVKEQVIEPESSCCSSKPEIPKPIEASSEDCCSSNKSESSEKQGFVKKAIEGIVYSFTELFTMLLFWLCVGLLFAAAVKTFVPTSFLTEWGSGLPAMLLMVVIGIPMYVCATASTPIAAGFMLAGVSPGTALVFLMAGPATNISTLGVIGKELGKKSLTAYLAGVGIVAILAGLLTDYLVDKLGIDIQSQLQAGTEMVPQWLAISSLLLLCAAAGWSFKKR